MIESVENITFNGVDLAESFSDSNNINHDYLIVNRVEGRGIIGAENSIVSSLGRDGAYSEYNRIQPRYIAAEITIKAPSWEELRKKLERMNGLLHVKEDVEISFADEPDRIYYGKIDGVDEALEGSHIHKSVITFLCSNPFKYGKNEVEEELSGDDVMVENVGTFDTRPVFELVAKDKATFAMVANAEGEYNMIGKPADVEEVIVDERTTVLTERGESISSWSSSGTIIDSTSAEVTGTLGTDGTGIVVLSYGTPTASATWYGPALIKEIAPIQDFEVEMRLRAETKRPTDVYRIEFYLFNENMQPIGKMAIWDNLQTKYSAVAEARVGDFVGAHQNYLISSRNYNLDIKHFHGVIRMRRVGSRFEFYVARTASGGGETGRHYDGYSAIFNDLDSQYMGRLKYVQIHIGTHQKGTKASLPRINNFKIAQLNQATIDQTPYILDIGDVVTFDHANRDILVNGESRKDLKDFGAKFFDLGKGYNTILISPENTFDTTLRYRERWL